MCACMHVSVVYECGYGTCVWNVCVHMCVGGVHACVQAQKHRLFSLFFWIIATYSFEAVSLPEACFPHLISWQSASPQALPISTWHSNEVTAMSKTKLACYLDARTWIQILMVVQEVPLAAKPPLQPQEILISDHGQVEGSTVFKTRRVACGFCLIWWTQLLFVN